MNMVSLIRWFLFVFVASASVDLVLVRRNIIYIFRNILYTLSEILFSQHVYSRFRRFRALPITFFLSRSKKSIFLSFRFSNTYRNRREQARFLSPHSRNFLQLSNFTDYIWLNLGIYFRKIQFNEMLIISRIVGN